VQPISTAVSAPMGSANLMICCRVGQTIAQHRICETIHAITHTTNWHVIVMVNGYGKSGGCAGAGVCPEGAARGGTPETRTLMTRMIVLLILNHTSISTPLPAYRRTCSSSNPHRKSVTYPNTNSCTGTFMNI